MKWCATISLNMPFFFSGKNGIRSCFFHVFQYGLVECVGTKGESHVITQCPIGWIFVADIWFCQTNSRTFSTRTSTLTNKQQTPGRKTDSVLFNFPPTWAASLCRFTVNVKKKDGKLGCTLEAWQLSIGGWWNWWPSIAMFFSVMQD